MRHVPSSSRALFGKTTFSLTVQVAEVVGFDSQFELIAGIPRIGAITSTLASGQGIVNGVRC